MAIQLNEGQQTVFTLHSTDVDDTFTASSSAPAIASVSVAADGTGTVKALKAGVATIEVTVAEPTPVVLTFDCTVVAAVEPAVTISFGAPTP